MTRTEDAAYRDALERLFARTTGEWKLGLERVHTLLAMMGDPHRRYPIFHVAGTNGKGSTVATLSAILGGSGLRVGRYTSPHLVDFRERIVIDDQAIAPATIVEWLAQWEERAMAIGATFFETTTAMAFSYFADAAVDVAVIEVGLGGRLDATNVVHPLVAAVTQIGEDHTDYLGDTLEKIASEKAGIFKGGAAGVVGELNDAIRHQLVNHARDVGAAPVLEATVDWSVHDIDVSASGTTFTLRVGQHDRRLHTPLIGAFQACNTATALAMLRAAGGKWATFEARAADLLADVHLAGRFHHAGRFLFDVAHNPDGAAALVDNVRHLAPSGSLVALVSVLRDKDWHGILRVVHQVADRIVVTVAPTAPAQRVWDLAEVRRWAEESGIAVTAIEDFDEALRHVQEFESTILITGSFHTVGDAMERLQVDPLAR